MNSQTNSGRAVDPNDWIDAAAAQQPRRLFVRTPAGRQLTYGELRAEAEAFGAALLARGVVAGERVVVRVEKSVESVLLYLACLRVGAVFVPVNVAHSVNEVEYMLRDASPRLCVVAPQERAALAPLAERAGVHELETLGTEGDGSLALLAHAARSNTPLEMRHAPQATAAIVYTSGTTGRAKGAMLTRANLSSNATALAAAWRFSAADVLLHALPLFHVHGLFTAINTVLAAGSGMLLLPKFEARTVLQHLAGASVFMGVPTHYTRLLHEPGLSRTALAHLRLCVSGSAPLLPETHQEFLRRTGHSVLERYGMTETLMNTSNPYDGPRLPGSVGPPLPGVALRVAREGGEGVGAQAVGELEVSGPNVFAGYWGDAEKTRSAFTADGWFRTGDLGRIDERGYVYIVGRAKDLIISGGYNVYPREVEAELDALPGVAESAVFGVAHPDLGEGVTAAVVTQPGVVLSEAEIIAAVRPRLARYKVPKRVLLVAELPRNAMGKIQKNALRASHASLYSAA